MIKTFFSVAQNSGRRILLAVSALLISTPLAKAQDGGVTHVDTVPAPSLRKNLVGDPDRRAMTIYLPPSYAKDRHRRYPVVYLLHGFAADHRAFMKGAYQNLNTRISMDSLIHAGAVKEMIVVTPNARDFFDGSFYVNSPVTGNWEDFIVHDLVGYVDKHYRTIPKASARGITGHSMGGYGSLWVGMRHPETFSAIYLMSACCLTSGMNVGGATPAVWKKVLGLHELSDTKTAGFVPDIVLALGAVYDPDPSSPPFFMHLPYALSGDSLVEVPAVAEKWNRSPLNMVPTYAKNLKHMAIAFDAGRQDAFKDIPVNVTRLDSMLTAMGIDHTAELYDGNHGTWIRKRLETKAFPFFSQHLH
jgi:enterochelin esterase-like enzyme